MNRFKIIVPASSANLGPGFDSMGLAVNIYLTLKVKQQENWEFISPSAAADSPYEEHFIYRVAKKTADKYGKVLPPCRVEEISSIPLARGLGSSASAIIAGIELANQLSELKLSDEEKLAYATELEGHPDNVAPALFGGLIISTYIDGEIDWIKLSDFSPMLAVYIPNIELKTDTARDVLPAQYSRNEAALASGVSNLVVASLLNGDYALAGKMMEKDRFHEPFRKELIPNYDLIKSEARVLGAYGTTISGAGPTMISFVHHTNRKRFIEHFSKVLPDYRIEELEMDRTGLRVEFLDEEV